MAGSSIRPNRPCGANQLRELEANGLIERKIYAEVPPKVEYSLSALGRSMEPILLALKHWGDMNIDRFGRPVPPAEPPSRQAA